MGCELAVARPSGPVEVGSFEVREDTDMIGTCVVSMGVVLRADDGGLDIDMGSCRGGIDGSGANFSV